MARNLGRPVSCSLHSGCPAMILTAGFHGDSGLISFGKSSGQIRRRLSSNKCREFIEQAFKREVLEKIWMIFGRDIVER